MLEIKETTRDDLQNIIALWGNGDVMKFVGFPEGYHQTMEAMEKWLIWVGNKPMRAHYSIYKDGIYCGETFYNVINEYAAVDIKLLPEFRGLGIGTKALKYAIDKAFKEGKAQAVYVDPNKDNIAAWALYKKLGFVEKEAPSHLDAGNTYQEIRVDQWMQTYESVDSLGIFK